MRQGNSMGETLSAAYNFHIILMQAPANLTQIILPSEL